MKRWRAVVLVLLCSISASADEPAQSHADKHFDRAHAEIAVGGLAMLVGTLGAFLAWKDALESCNWFDPTAIACHETRDDIVMGVGAGLFLVGAGTVAWGLVDLHSAHEEQSRAHRLTVVPAVSPTGAGVRLQLRF